MNDRSRRFLFRVLPCSLLGIALFSGAALAVEPEECDDGNTTPGDGCDAMCTIESVPGAVCGDGNLDPPGFPVSRPTIRPEDFGCNGFDPPWLPSSDDTACWQAAIEAAKQTDPIGYGNFYGTVEATAGAHYRITDTLTVCRTANGLIEGNGAVFEWWGTNPNIPMWYLVDTSHLEIRNLEVFVRAGGLPLETAFEFTNADDGHPSYPAACTSPVGQTATTNLLNNVLVEGTSIGVDYGVRFSCGPPSNSIACAAGFLDANNDLSTIMNSTFFNVRKAAISIEHTQSHQHRLINVSGYGSLGNESIDTVDVDVVYGVVKGASFVRHKAGGFSSTGGFQGNFRNASFYLNAIYTPILIIDSNGEGNARLIETPRGWTSFHQDVHVLGGRFAINELAADGRIVDWTRQGPLTIKGLRIDGCVHDACLDQSGNCIPGCVTDPPPKLYFAPSTGFGSLDVTGVMFLMEESATWDPIEIGPYARVNTSSNLCTSGPVAGDCIGIAGGVSSSSVRHAQLSAELAGLENHWTYCADCKADTSPCEAGGTGALATRVSGLWDCGGSKGFRTHDAPAGTDPVADATADVLTYVKGRSIGVTGDATADSVTISAEPELYTATSSIYLRGTGTGGRIDTTLDDHVAQLAFPSPGSATLERVFCSTGQAGTVVTVQLYRRTESSPNSGGSTALQANLACDSNSESTTLFTGSGLISANEILSLDVVSITGTPKTMRLHVQTRLND